MLDFNATLSPGYTDAVTLPLEEKAKFKTNQPQFHWNLVTRLSNQIREKTGESEGWRQMVLTLISEKSWLILERGNSGETYGSLERLICEGMSLKVLDFVEAVARFAGPDMVDNLRPHLEFTCQSNIDTSATLRSTEAHNSRQAAAAPEIAVRLRAADLITQRDLQRLGQLNSNEAHQETLELITDRLNELTPPPATASATDRRHFRAEVKAVIEKVLPEPQPQSKVVRFPNNAERALAIIQEHLSAEELGKLQKMICDGVTAPPKRKRSRAADQPITREEALDQIMKLESGEFATTRIVFALVDPPFKNMSDLNAKYRTGGEISGNGWRFKKHTSEEMVEKGFGPKAASWEVLEYGEG